MSGGQTGGDAARHAKDVLAAPGRAAAWVAGIYFVVCALYIGVSGVIAANLAESKEQLLRIEILKGTLFVFASAGLIYLLCSAMLRRIARDRDVLAAQADAISLAERRCLAGMLASSVAHDMNNILAVGVASADLLKHGGGLSAEQAELTDQINDSFTRMTDLTRRLTELSRSSTRVDLMDHDLAGIVAQEVAFARRHERLRSRTLAFDGPATLQAKVSAPMIQQMIMNLLLNAGEAAGEGGRVETRLTQSGANAVLEIHDSGRGVVDADRERVFEPAYSTKPDGLGLGLLSVKAAARAHRGKVEITSSPLGGALFRVTIPLAPA